MKTSKAIERALHALTILSFFALCWTAHRALEPRTDCVNSSFISFVQVNDQRIANCRFESRLNPRSLLKPLNDETRQMIRDLEVLEPLTSWLKGPRLGLAVDLSLKDPELFELGKGYVRLGSRWLKDATQIRRALTMGVLRNQNPEAYTNQFQLEVIADFLLLAIFDRDEWVGPGKIYSVVRDLRFSTSAPSFDQYCASPFLSLSHRQLCRMNGEGIDMDLVNVWGLRPLLAVSLWRVFEKLGLADQLTILNNLASGKALPVVGDVRGTDSEGLAAWFEMTMKNHLAYLLPKPTPALELAEKRTLKELEVEPVTHWELTVDLTATPAWREILEQMRQRSVYRPRERVLIFTPEGATALPSNLPVTWAADEISSQKHVMIACAWPRPEDTVHIQARRIFAQQSCTKLTRPFWD